MREEDPGDEWAGESGPRDHIALGLDINVVIKHRDEERDGFPTGNREDVCRSVGKTSAATRGVIELGSSWLKDEEVHGLECVDVPLAGAVLVVKNRDDEEDDVEHEADNHHPPVAICSGRE